MRDGQVEDQAPAASGIAQILSDLHVAAAVACAGRHLMLGVDVVTPLSGRVSMGETKKKICLFKVDNTTPLL